jgi:nucleotide-binding universal stress UspA family protein
MTDREKPYVILVAVQFDETGDRALQEAIRIAEAHKSVDLHLVHVVRDSSAAAAAASEMLSLNVRMAQTPEQLKQVLVHTPVQRTAHIRAGAAVQSILQTAADLDADLIVLGTHKRTGIEKLVLGSVAEHLLKEAHCPILVAVAKDHERAHLAACIEPPCQDCVNVRLDTANTTHWCERHSHSRLRPHVYVPSDRAHVGAAGQ